PDRAQPALSENRGIACASESAGSDVFPDVLGLHMGRAGPAAGDSADRWNESGLRQREGAARVREVFGGLARHLLDSGFLTSWRIFPNRQDSSCPGSLIGPASLKRRLRFPRGPTRAFWKQRPAWRAKASSSRC